MMVMGLRNASTTFQRLINGPFRGLTYNILYSYIDDAIISSETIPQHIKRLNMAFERLERGNLKLNTTNASSSRRVVKDFTAFKARKDQELIN